MVQYCPHSTHIVLISNMMFLQHIRQVGMERQKCHVLAPYDRDTRIAANVSEHGGIGVTPKQIDKIVQYSTVHNPNVEFALKIT